MKSKTFAIWFVMVLATLGVAAIATYERTTPRLPAPESEPPVSVITTPSPELSKKTVPQAATFSLYVPTMGADGIAFTKSTETIPEGEDPKLFAVNAFLKASDIVPEGAEALGVDMRDGIAIIGFNKAFDQTYGSFDEKKLVDGLAATLGQFPEVKSYEMQIEGKPVTTLGSADLSEAILVTRPEAVPMKPGDEKSSTPPPPDQPN
jgi:hypothetical protein